MVVLSAIFTANREVEGRFSSVGCGVYDTSRRKLNVQQ